MDMPESCPDCRFFESDWKECYAISKRYNRDVMTEEAKPNWCPLRELPEKNPNNPELKPGVHYTEKGYEVFKSGWNACLDKILKDDGMRKE